MNHLRVIYEQSTDLVADIEEIESLQKDVMTELTATQ